MAKDSVNEAALRVYRQEVGKVIDTHESRLQLLSSVRREAADVKEMLQQHLPAKLTHQISVPFGRHAFFLGHIQHPSEVVVHLGAKYYVECTALAAADIVGRRLDVLDNEIDGIQRQLKSHHTRLELSSPSLATMTAGGAGLGLQGQEEQDHMEIRESYEESEQLLGSAKPGTPSKPSHSGAAEQSGTGVAPTSEKGPGTAPVVGEQDVEFKRLFSRMDELERLERLAEAGDEADLADLVGSALQLDESKASERHAGPPAVESATASGISYPRSVQASRTGQSSMRSVDAVVDGADSAAVADAFAAVPVAPSLGGAAPRGGSYTGSGSTAGPRASTSSSGGFKKGFLVQSSGPRGGGGSSSSGGGGQLPSSSSSGSGAIVSVKEAEAAAEAKPPAAFTGQVTERSSVTSAPSGDIGRGGAAKGAGVSQTQGGDVGSRGVVPPASSVEAKPMSQFMLKRMGRG